MFFGICGGLSDMLNVDVTLVRLLMIVLALISSGALILVYILAGIVIPKDPYSGFGPGGYDDYYDGYGHQHGGFRKGGPQNFGGGFGGNGSFGGGSGSGSHRSYGGAYKNPPQDAGQFSSDQFDNMMDDLEKKALRREIEELKAKLAKYEKGEF
ncbi:PspC domain-containing protein [Paenibacillus protaetiae]|nr:PspC domain-containing protein [Paenibacillus protaetiae]